MEKQTGYIFENRYGATSAEFKASCLVMKSDLEKPIAGEGQLVVQVHAVGLNPVDYKVGSFGFLSVITQ